MNTIKNLAIYNSELRTRNDGLGDLVAEFEDIEGMLDLEISKKVIRYMNTGIVFEQWLSSIRDIRNEKLLYENKTSTDGEYMWTDEVRRNIEHYKLQVPKEFLEKIDRTNGVCDLEESEALKSKFSKGEFKCVPVYMNKSGDETLTGIPYDEQS